MKFRNSRGPNCEDASCNATIVIENVTLAMVIIEPATADSTARDPSGPRKKVQPKAASHSCEAVTVSS